MIELPGGVTVSIASLERLWMLEARGIRICRRKDRLEAGPADRVTAEDRAWLAEHRALIDWVLDQDIPRERVDCTGWDRSPDASPF